MLNTIANGLSRFNKLVWETESSTLGKWGKRGLAALRIAYLTIRDVFFDSQLTLRSMSLVYTTLLSLVPLLAVSVSVLKGFGAHNQLELALRNFLLPLGDRGAEITGTIVRFVEGINSGLLGSVGMAMLLYTVISLMQKIEAAFNFTWHVTEDRSFARRFSDYLSVVLIGPVLVFSAVGLTATLTHSEFYLLLAANPVTGILITFLGRLVPYLLIIFAFTLIYIYIPNTKVLFRSAFVGAAVAGVIWETVGWLFASFITSANYTAIYSAFATLFFFMIWLYISWTILLTGASIAFYYQNPEFRARQRRHIALSNRMREKLAFAVMAKVVTHFYQRKPPLTLQELAQSINIASDMLHPIVNNLVTRQILARTDTETTEFIPAQAPEDMPLMEILLAVREADEDDVMNAHRITLSSDVESLFQTYQDAAADALAGKTLKDLVLNVDTNGIEHTNAQRQTG
ncbi:MAG: YihY family inner membrane protein [Gammaproteobacteria bacterium]|nr:YihY family inner membrane protein [Gammaproteobacteria bacterium]